MSASPLLSQVRARLVEAPSRPEQAAATVRRASGVLTDDITASRWDREAADELAGAGPLERLVALPGVTDVLVNGPHEVWIDRHDRLTRVGLDLGDEAAVRRLAHRLAASAGRRLDDAQPWVDACLADGTRLHAVLPPLVPHTTISLRVLRRRRFDLAGLVASGLLTADLAGVLRAAVRARMSVLISGGTGVGKTTLLGALLSVVAAEERIITVEDAAELDTSHPHVVRLTCRPANVEGSGAVGPADLVRQALRMRPDRIVVGEFRGAEIVDLMAALNTGHAGGLASVHANSPRDVPARLTALAALAGTGEAVVNRHAASAFDLVVHLARAASGRTVQSLGVPEGSGPDWGVLESWRADGRSVPGAAMLRDRLTAGGGDPDLIERVVPVSRAVPLGGARAVGNSVASGSPVSSGGAVSSGGVVLSDSVVSSGGVVSSDSVVSSGGVVLSDSAMSFDGMAAPGRPAADGRPGSSGRSSR